MPEAASARERCGISGGGALQDWALGFFPAWQTPKGSGLPGDVPLWAPAWEAKAAHTCQVIYSLATGARPGG